jgi:hypothetical protein
MKAVILYHPQSEQARPVEEFVHELTRQSPASTIELLSLEDRKGAEMAELYGVMNYPALFVVQHDGQVLKMWDGLPLPLRNEVVGYLNS